MSVSIEQMAELSAWATELCDELECIAQSIIDKRSLQRMDVAVRIGNLILRDPRNQDRLGAHSTTDTIPAPAFDDEDGLAEVANG